VSPESRVVYELERARRWLRVTIDPVKGGDGSRTAPSASVADVTAAKVAEHARQELLGSERAARAAARRPTARRTSSWPSCPTSCARRSPRCSAGAACCGPRTWPPDKARRAFEIIDRNTRVQAQLVDDLLDVSRIVSGKLSLESASSMSRGSWRARWTPCDAAAIAKGVEVRTAIEGALRPITGDAARLQQVVSNLVSNAVKFTPAGGRVDVMVRMASDTVAIEVRDTASASRRSSAAHLRTVPAGDGTSRRSQGGLGLGLAIVRYITDLHHGTVVAASEGPGKGATFTLTLPARRRRP